MRATMRTASSERDTYADTSDEDTSDTTDMTSNTHEATLFAKAIMRSAHSSYDHLPSRFPMPTANEPRSITTRNEGRHLRDALSTAANRPPPSPYPHGMTAAAAATSEGELLAALYRRVKKGVVTTGGSTADLLTDLREFARAPGPMKSEGEVMAAAYRRGRDRVREKARKNAEERGSESRADGERTRSAEIWRAEARGDEYAKALRLLGVEAAPYIGGGRDNAKSLVPSMLSSTSNSSVVRRVSSNADGAPTRATGAGFRNRIAAPSALTDLVDTLGDRLKTVLDEHAEKRDVRRFEKRAAEAVKRRVQLKQAISAPLDAKGSEAHLLDVGLDDRESFLWTVRDRDDAKDRSEVERLDREHEEDTEREEILPWPDSPKAQSLPLARPASSPGEPQTLEAYRRAYSPPLPASIDRRTTQQTTLGDFMAASPPPSSSPASSVSFSVRFSASEAPFAEQHGRYTTEMLSRNGSARQPHGHFDKLGGQVRSFASTIREGYKTYRQRAPSDASVYCVGLDDGAPGLAEARAAARPARGSEEEYERALSGCADAYGVRWADGLPAFGQRERESRVDSGLQTVEKEQSLPSVPVPRQPGIGKVRAADPPVLDQDVYVPPRADWNIPRAAASGGKHPHNSYYAMVEEDRQHFVWI